MIVTLWPFAEATRPAHVDELKWSELCDEVSEMAQRLTPAPKKADEETQKKALPGIGPHRLREGETRRLLENVEAVTVGVLDIDNEPPPKHAADAPHVDPETIVNRLRKKGFAALLYASPRDTPERRKFRVVVPLTRELDPKECPDFRKRLAEAVGLGPWYGVEGAIDAAKLFFVGRLHGTPRREVWRVPGKPVDPDALPPTRKPWGAKKTAKAAPSRTGPLPSASSGIAAALGSWAEHEGRRWELCGAVGGLMRRLGYSAAQCEAEIRAWLPSDNPDVNVDHGLKWALGAWAKEPGEVSGTDTLAGIVGAEHAAVIESAARAGSSTHRAIERIRKARDAGSARLGSGFVADAAVSDDPLGPEFDWTGPVPKIDYYCEGLRLAPSKGKISLIGGLPGAGKGPLANYLALCFSLGLDAFGRWPCRKSRTILLDCEGMALTAERIARMSKGLRRKPKELAGMLSLRDVSGLQLFTPGFFEALEAWGPEVVILDSYTSAMLTTDADPNKPEFAKLAHAFAQLGCLVLAVAHGRKIPNDQKPTLTDISGSGALGALAATGISCYHPDPEDNNLVRITCMRAPRDAFEPFDVRFSDGSWGDGLLLEAENTGESAKAAKAETTGRVLADVYRVFCRTSAKPRSIKAVTGDVTGNNGAIKDAVLALEKAGFLVAEEGSRTTEYVLAGDAPSAVEIGPDGTIRAKARGQRDPKKGPGKGPRVGGFSRERAE